MPRNIIVSREAPQQSGWLLWLNWSYWAALLVGFVLSLSPRTIFANDASGLEATPGFKAFLLVALVLFGVLITLLSSRGAHISHLLTMHRRAPQHLKWLVLAIGWLLVSTAVPCLAPVVRALGSTDRFDGALMQALWLSLAAVSAGLAAKGLIAPFAVLRLALIGAGCTAVWTLLQAIGRDPLTAISVAGIYVDIPAGAFGHGALASAYLGFVLVLWLGFRYFGGTRRRWDMAVSALLGIGIGSAGGRAAIMGLLVAFALMVMFAAISERRRPTYLLLNGIAVAAAIFACAALLPRAHAQAQRTVAALKGQDSSFNNRIPAWRTGLKVAAAYPILGVGPGGFAFAALNHASKGDKAMLIEASMGGQFGQPDWTVQEYASSGNILVFPDPESGQQIAATFRWDKAHHYLLDLALTAGIPAAVFFLLFAGSALLLMWRSESPFARGAALAFVGFLVFGLAWFPTISLDPAIWPLVGAGLGFASGTTRRPASSPAIY